jgi:hypothetical protein
MCGDPFFTDVASVNQANDASVQPIRSSPFCRIVRQAKIATDDDHDNDDGNKTRSDGDLRHGDIPPTNPTASATPEEEERSSSHADGVACWAAACDPRGGGVRLSGGGDAEREEERLDKNAYTRQSATAKQRSTSSQRLDLINFPCLIIC